MPLVSGVDSLGRPVYGDTATLPDPSTNNAVDTALGTYAPTPKTNSIDYSHFATRLSNIREQGTAATTRTQYAIQQAAELKAKEEQAKQLQMAQDAAKNSQAALANLKSQYALYGDSSNNASLRQKLVAQVASQKGVKYQWGGESPKTGFDCSGLVQWAYGKLGIQMPRTSGQQAKVGVKWPVSKLEPGDLVAHPGHIAVYAGNGMMWESPHTGASVRLVPVRSDMYGVHLYL